MKVVLRILSGPRSGESFEVGMDGAVLGRDRGDLLLPDASVSGQHARIYWEGGRFLLKDLRSANGTFLDERYLTGDQELPIPAYGKLKLGHTLLNFRCDGAPPPEAPRPFRPPIGVVAETDVGRPAPPGPVPAKVVVSNPPSMVSGQILMPARPESREASGDAIAGEELRRLRDEYRRLSDEHQRVLDDRRRWREDIAKLQTELDRLHVQKAPTASAAGEKSQADRAFQVRECLDVLGGCSEALVAAEKALRTGESTTVRAEFRRAAAQCADLRAMLEAILAS